MQLTRSKYRFTISDTTQIVDLGYTISPSDSVSFEEFMAKTFPNFNLAKLLESLETYFVPTTALKIKKLISYDTQLSTLHLSFTNEFKNDDEALIFDRIFAKSGTKITIDHVFCVLPLNFRGKGIISQVFKVCLREYFNMNATTIQVYAGLNDGGFVWARFGFVATIKTEVEVILENAKNHLSRTDYEPVSRIFSWYYDVHSGGREFPMVLWAKMDQMIPILRGSRWHGQLDMNNSEQFSNFIDYVFRR